MKKLFAENSLLKFPREPTQRYLQPVHQCQCYSMGSFYFANNNCEIDVRPEAAEAIGVDPKPHVQMRRSVLEQKVEEGFLKVVAASDELSMKVQCYDKTFYLAPETKTCTVIHGTHYKHPHKVEYLLESVVTSWLGRTYTIVTFSELYKETTVLCDSYRHFVILPIELVKGKH